MAIQTIGKLEQNFVAKRHAPSTVMWDAISDIVLTLEQMANETAEDAIYVSSLDPGVGKTQSIVQFLPIMLASDQHTDVSALICAGRLRQIEDVINDAKNAGLRDQDFAVFTSDERLNRLGCGIEHRHNARVLFTTHAMVMKKCEASGSFTEAEDFHYGHQTRAVRVWDEAFMPGLAVTLNQNDIASLIKPMSATSTDFADQLLDLAATLRKSKDQDRLMVPDLQTKCGIDLNTLERVFSDAPEDQKTAANSLWFLFDKMVTVRRDGGYGNAMIDYRETLPKGLAPLLVLDASSRRSIRETYNLWEEERGEIIRLRDAPKDYSALTIHHWNTGGGKTAFKDPTTGARLIQGVANTISSKPTEKWLVVHHKHPSFEREVRVLLDAGADVSFLNWGAHDATNDFADVPNVILAGTLFYRTSYYDATGRAAAGHPSSAGAFPREKFERVRRGEHRHTILQAVCRGRVRKCEGSRCPRSDVYLIASQVTGIPADLHNIFPSCRVVPWKPVRTRLTGQVGDAVAFILEQTATGGFVSNGEVMEHLGIRDGSNFRRTVAKHPDLVWALDESGICTHIDGRRRGFQSQAVVLFGNVEEASVEHPR